MSVFFNGLGDFNERFIQPQESGPTGWEPLLYKIMEKSFCPLLPYFNLQQALNLQKTQISLFQINTNLTNPLQY